jgi:hypothetical protein
MPGSGEQLDSSRKSANNAVWGVSRCVNSATQEAEKMADLPNIRSRISISFVLFLGLIPSP